MKNITLETQIQALYDKAKAKQGQSDGSTTFKDSLQSTIERMNEISVHADDALKSLSRPKVGELKAELDQAGLIHRKMMEEQHNLAALYNKLNITKNS